MAVPVSSFPAMEAFKLLEDAGARYVVFHLHFYDRRSREKLLDAIDSYQRYLRPLWRGGRGLAVRDRRVSQSRRVPPRPAKGSPALRAKSVGVPRGV